MAKRVKKERPVPGADHSTQAYETARERAQKRANATGMDIGLERSMFGFTTFVLPRKENRYGHELQCEVVMCERLEKCQPGHGPTAVVRTDGRG